MISKQIETTPRGPMPLFLCANDLSSASCSTCSDTISNLIESRAQRQSSQSYYQYPYWLTGLASGAISANSPWAVNEIISSCTHVNFQYWAERGQRSRVDLCEGCNDSNNSAVAGWSIQVLNKYILCSLLFRFNHLYFMFHCYCLEVPVPWREEWLMMAVCTVYLVCAICWKPVASQKYYSISEIPTCQAKW